MADRDQVIATFEKIADCNTVTLKTLDGTILTGVIVAIPLSVIEDALALLKEQEPRVMTLEEIVKRAGEKDPDPIFVEWRISGYTQWSVASIGIVASAVKSEPEFVRAWTSRPTDEQRKAVAWDD